MQRALAQFDRAFPHSYEVEELAEFPGTGVFRVPVVFFPRDGRHGEALWLNIKAASGKNWVGVFASGQHFSGSARGIFSSPDRQTMLVLCYGSAYVVDAEHLMPRTGNKGICSQVAA
jgi:hypothetical protein